MYWNPTATPTTILVTYQPGVEADDITVLAAGMASDLVVYVETNAAENAEAGRSGASEDGN